MGMNACVIKLAETKVCKMQSRLCLPYVSSCLNHMMDLMSCHVMSLPAAISSFERVLSRSAKEFFIECNLRLAELQCRCKPSLLVGSGPQLAG